MKIGAGILDEAGLDERSADPAVRATNLIDNWDEGRVNAKKILADQFAEVDKAFKRARKELEGLRKAGAGDTESPALLKKHVDGPLRRLREVVATAYGQVEEVAK